MSTPDMPMPPPNRYAPPLGRFYRMVWYEPFTHDGLVIYGRDTGSIYPEDAPELARMARRGRISGEWFSVACVDGELGTNPAEICAEITADEFSRAYVCGWDDPR